MKRASITDLCWHDLRHEYASRLAERGVPLSQSRDLLGHSSIVTTERYDNQSPMKRARPKRTLILCKISSKNLG
jgi:site-specific recombinase XerD